MIKNGNFLFAFLGFYTQRYPITSSDSSTKK